MKLVMSFENKAPAMAFEAASVEVLQQEFREAWHMVHAHNQSIEERAAGRVEAMPDRNDPDFPAKLDAYIKKMKADGYVKQGAFSFRGQKYPYVFFLDESDNYTPPDVDTLEAWWEKNRADVPKETSATDPACCGGPCDSQACAKESCQSADH